MRNLIIVFVFLTGSGLSYAQQIDLAGRISIHNSRYRTGKIQYVPDASIEAPFAGATISNPEGEFNLTFNGIERGAPISLTVERAGLEIVNERDLLNVVLGRKQPLRVFLARKGELTQRQTEFYDVSLATITSRHDALIASLRSGGEESTRAIQELERQFNKEFEHRYEAEDLLREQLEEAKKRLPGMAKRLAEVNLDFTSSTYRNAYEWYRKGEVEKAIEALNEIELTASADRIARELAVINADQKAYSLALAQEEDKLDQIIQAYQLKAEAFSLVFDYRAAAKVSEKAIELLLIFKSDFDPKLGEAHELLAEYYNELGAYDQSIIAYKTALVIAEKIYTRNSMNVAMLYSKMSDVYSLNSNYLEAIKSSKYAIGISLQHNPIDSFLIMVCNGNIAVNYRYIGDIQSSIGLQKEVVRYLSKEGEANSQQLMASYNNIALAYLDQKEPELALEWQLKSMKLTPFVFKENNPKIALLENNLALSYLSIDSCNIALRYIESAIKRLNNSYFSQHPTLGMSYDNQAGIYSCLGEYELALKAQKNGIRVLRLNFSESNPVITTSKKILGTILEENGEYESARLVYKNVLSERLKAFSPDHPLTIDIIWKLVVIGANLARSYEKEKRFEDAISAEIESINYVILRINNEDVPRRIDSVRIAREKLYLAELYQKNSDIEMAIKEAEESLRLRQLLFAEQDSTIVISYQMLSSFHLANGAIDKFTFYQKILYELLSRYRTPSDYTLTAINNSLFLIYTYDAIGAEEANDFSAAANLYLKAIEHIYSNLDNQEYKTQGIEGYDKSKLIIKIGLCSYQAGDYKTALEYFDKSYAIEGVPEYSYLYLSALCHAQLGQLEKTKDLFQKMEKLSDDQGIAARNWAMYHMFLHEEELALNKLEKAFSVGYRDWKWLEQEGRFNGLRGKQRYQLLIQKMKKN